jgi:CubicO group peptidase (beta-lactamase class C family)
MMRPTRREFAAAAAAFVLTPRLQRTAADSKPVITPPKDAFFRELAKLMEVTAVPGIAIAIVDGGKPIWQRTAGVMDAATKAPIGPDTLFPAASLGKPVAAYVALRLAADGKLDLDRPLKSYVPDHVPADPRSDKVTTRHVLSHSTGFRNWRNSAEQPLTSDFEPGSRFQYSGEGFYYLQRAMEKIAGRGFDQLMQEQLFEPLSMRSATYAWRSDTDARLVTGHNRGNPVRGQNRDFAIRLFQYAASQK